MADSSRPDEDEAPPAPVDEAPAATEDIEDDDSQIHLLPPDEGPVHRPLIRAQLPRPEGTKVERQAPEFTIRQNNGRPGGFRGRGGQSSGNGNGHGGQRFGRGPMRGGHGGGGFNRGHGGGNQQRHGGGPRKRSR